MVVRTREAYENSGLEVIIDNSDILWLNEKNMEGILRHGNLLVITKKYHSDYRKHGF